MVTELQLRFKADTGTNAAFIDVYDEDEIMMTAPSPDYLGWLEDLALKQVRKDRTLEAEITKLRGQLKYACEILDKNNLR